MITTDIEGASPGTRKTKGVKNKELANKYRSESSEHTNPEFTWQAWRTSRSRENNFLRSNRKVETPLLISVTFFILRIRYGRLPNMRGDIILTIAIRGSHTNQQEIHLDRSDSDY